DPGLLKGMGAVRREAFDRRDRPLPQRADGQRAGPLRLARDEDRARAALSDPAAVLGSRQPEEVTQDPQQRHVPGGRDLVFCPVPAVFHDAPFGPRGRGLVSGAALSPPCAAPCLAGRLRLRDPRARRVLTLPPTHCRYPPPGAKGGPLRTPRGP